LKAIQPDVKSI